MPDRPTFLQRLRPKLAEGPAWAVLAVSLAFTIVAAFVTDRLFEQSAEARLASRQQEIEAAIVGRLAAYEQILLGGRGYLMSSDRVSREDWRTYVSALALDRQYPGIDGVGFAEWIKPADKPAYEARLRAEGFPDFTIRPPGYRDTYTSIVYLEPPTSRNARAFGYDMWSDPVRRGAMQRALETGETSLSGRVRLVQEGAAAGSPPGFLLYVPHYGRSEPSTVEERRAAIQGFVYTPFRLDGLMDGALEHVLAHVRLRIYGGSVLSQETLLFDSADPGLTGVPAPHSGESAVSPVAFYGQRWVFRYTALPSFTSGIDRHAALIIFLAGIAISVLTFGMTLSLSQRRRADAVSARLGRIVEGARGEIYVFDANTLRLLQTNRSASDNTGYSLGELRSMTPLDLAPTIGRPALHSAIHALRLGQREQVLLQTVQRRKDGSTYPVEINLQLSREESPPVVIAFVQDISDRQKAEAHRQLLIDELNHRVKNTLAKVQSLVTQTLAGSRSPEQFARSFQGRLRALADAHNLLTQTHWRGAALHDLARRQLAPYQRAGDANIRIAGEGVLLKPAATLALGLAFHELATNAAKYGALAVEHGRVNLRWTARASENTADLVVEWVEEGGPQVKPRTSRGFGSTLIERGLAHEIDARVRMEFRADGLKCTIAVPWTPETFLTPKPIALAPTA
ncbi:MAG TPA: CHASE domain-containing protein [Alphaproteobacteria bacterium]|nr:CHASE domain-containing protein [Alphaproteobacteria bacterium]